ncbi:MAG: LysR family transcriptional regulator [Actinobacteria bacterium]|nr:LysR family transcriptional regulator [Actinomycetota bacterium]
MELRQLEYLVAVAEEASFTRAARRVHVAQPGVSAQVRRLERELGQDLLDRSGRAVTLTAAGAVVLPYARAALAAVTAARTAIDEFTGLLRGRLTIGTLTSVSSPRLDLPALLASYHRDHPAVQITLTVGHSSQLTDAVRDGQYDLAFIGLAGSPPAGLATQVIADEPLAAVVPPDDPLAAETSLPLAALASRPLISLPPGAGLRAALEAACAAAGFSPQVAFEAGDPRVVAELAAHGLAAAIVPRSVADARADRLHTITLTDPEPCGRLALAWRAAGPVSPAARELITRVRQAVSDG